MPPCPCCAPRQAQRAQRAPPALLPDLVPPPALLPLRARLVLAPLLPLVPPARCSSGTMKALSGGRPAGLAGQARGAAVGLQAAQAAHCHSSPRSAGLHCCWPSPGRSSSDSSMAAPSATRPSARAASGTRAPGSAAAAQHAQGRARLSPARHHQQCSWQAATRVQRSAGSAPRRGTHTDTPPRMRARGALTCCRRRRGGRGHTHAVHARLHGQVPQLLLLALLLARQQLALHLGARLHRRPRLLLCSTIKKGRAGGRDTASARGKASGLQPHKGLARAI